MHMKKSSSLSRDSEEKNGQKTTRLVPGTQRLSLLEGILIVLFIAKK